MESKRMPTVITRFFKTLRAAVATFFYTISKAVKKLKNESKKFRKYALPFALGATLITLPVVYLLFKNAQKTQAQWWPGDGYNYEKRKQLNIVNSSSATLHATTTVAITVDTQTLANTGQIKSDCSDVRVIYQPSDSTAIELTRHITYPAGTTCATSSASKIYFPLQADLSSGANSANYYMYFSNPDSDIPTNTDNAFDVGSKEALLVCPFDGSTTCAAGETPSTESGAIRYGGQKGALYFDGSNDYVDNTISLTSDKVTLEAWLYINHLGINGTNGQSESVIGGGYGTGITGWWGSLYFRQSIGGVTEFVPMNKITQQWTHYAVVYDGSEVRTYRNGVLQATEPASGNWTVNADLAVVGWSGRFGGAIDELRVSNTVRYTSDFTPQTSPFVTDENTVLLQHFDEGGDDPRDTGKAIDASGNGTDGTIYGAKYTTGVVGVDYNSSTNSGYFDRQAYASHEGIFVEEQTTNKVTNPSFEHTTFNTNWTATSTLTTHSENTTLPYTKFGSKSVKLIADANAGPLEGGGGGGSGTPTMEQHLEILTYHAETSGTSPYPTDNSLGLVRWDADKYPNSTVYFEAIITETGTGNCVARLYDSAGNYVTNSEVSGAPGGTYARYRSAALTLTDDTDYTVRINNSIAAGYTSIRAARLIIVQTNADGIPASQSNMELGYAEGTGNATYTEQSNQKVYYYDSSRFNPTPNAYLETTIDVAEPKIEQYVNIMNHLHQTIGTSVVPADNSFGIIRWDADKYPDSTVYFETTMTETGSGNVVAGLYTLDGTLVSNSTVSGAPGGNYTVYRSSAITLTDDTDYTVRFYNSTAAGESLISGARLIISQSNATKLTTTETQAELTLAEGTNSTTYVEPTRQKLYYYDSSLFTPSPTIYFEAAFKPASPKLEQQINIIDQLYQTTGTSLSPTDNSLGLVRWDADKFTGATVYFEAVMTETGSGNCVVGLYDSAGNLVSGSQFSDNPGSVYTLYRSSSLTLTDDTDYSIRAYNTNASGITYVSAARLIIIQENSTKITATQSSAEIGNNETSTQTSYTPLVDKKIQNYSSGQFSPSPTIYFEATLSNDTAGQTTYAALYENDSACNTQVSGSEISVTGTTWTRTRSSAISLTDTKDYMVCVKTSANTARISNAKIIYEQNDSGGISKLETYQMYTNTKKTTTSTSFTSTNINQLVDVANFGVVPDIYLDTVLYNLNGSDTTYSLLHNRTTVAALNSSEVSTSSTTPVRVRSSNLTLDMPKTSKTFSANIRTTSGGTAVTNSSQIVIRIQNLPTSGTTGAVELYNDTDGTSVSSSEVSTTTAGWQRIRSGSITLTSGKDYTIRMKNAIVAGAKIILDQYDANGITGLEIPVTLFSQYRTTSSTSYLETDNYYYFNPNAFGVVPQVYLETDLKETGTTAWVHLRESKYGNAISGTEYSSTSSAWTRLRTPTDIYNYLERDPRHYLTRIRTTNTGTIEVTGSEMLIKISNLPTSGATGGIELYNKTDTTSVSGSEITSATAGWQRLRSNSFSLTSGKEYIIRYKQARVANARLILEQNSAIRNIQVVQYPQITPISQSDNGYVRAYRMMYFDPANWDGGSSVSRYFQAYTKVSANDGNIDLYNVTGAATITNSNLNTSSTTYTRVTSSNIEANMPGTASEFDIRLDASSGQSVYTQYAALITDVTFDISGETAQYTTEVSPGGTGTHTLSAYVFDGTSGEVGGTVDENNARLVWEGSTVDSTTDGAIYTDMGGGWYRISYSAATTDTANDYGVAVGASETMYVDGFQLEEKSYPTTYVDGSLGTGYSWSGTANESSSTRGVTNIQMGSSGNIGTTTGSISFWFNPKNQGVFQTTRGAEGYTTWFSTNGSSRLLITRRADNNGGNQILITGAGRQLQYNVTSLATDGWKNYVFTWDSGTNTVAFYENGSAVAAAYDSGTFAALSGLSLLGIGKDTSGTYQVADSQLSDLRIFNAALTSTEVADIYYSGLFSRQETNQTSTIDRFSQDKGQDPVAVWHMDEGYGTTVNDSTPFLNHLSMGNASWNSGNKQTERYLTFDGVDDYIYRENDTDFNFKTNSFTISGMFKHSSSISATNTLLSKYGSAGYKVYLDSSRYLCFSIDDDSTWGPEDSVCTTTSLADNNWHTFSAVKDGTTSISLYVDGVLVGTDDTLSAPGSLSSTALLYVGIGSDGSSDPYKGSLDEFTVYPYARTAEQTKTDNLGSQTAVLIGRGSEDTITNGLIGWWKMDEAAENSCSDGKDNCDASGNDNNGAWTGTFTSVAGKYGNGGSFVDGASRYIAFDDDALYDFGTSDFTVGVWEYRTALGSWDSALITKWNSGGSPGTNEWTLSAGSGSASALTPGFSIESETTSYSANSPEDAQLNTWYHIVGQRKGDYIYVYVNGVEKARTYIGNAAVNNVSGRKLQLAKIDGGAYGFIGTIDDVRIYNRALDSSEILQLAKWAPGPIAYWKFDEGSWNGTSNEVIDSSGNNYHGTATCYTTSCSKPTTVLGKFGRAGNFNSQSSGDQRYINLGEPSGIRDLRQITISTWIKNESLPVTNNIFFNGGTGGGAGERGYYASIYNGRLFFRDLDLSSDSTQGTTTLSTGEWYYLTATYDGSTVKLYVNGKLDGQEASSGTLKSASGYNSYIGYASGADPNWYYINGLLDDLKVYDYARTQEQIISDMNAGHPAPGSPIGSPLFRTKFDEGYGTSANNSGNGGSAINLTLAGTPSWTNSGKHNKALNFDNGVSSARAYFDDTTSSPFDLTNDFTMGAWVYRTNTPTNQARIISKGDLYLLFTTTDNIPKCYMSDLTATTLAATTALPADTWTHVLCTYKDNVRKLYINGKLDNQDAPTGTISTSNIDFVIGNYETASDNYRFRGVIDEPTIYNFALSEDQVKIEFSSGATLNLGSTGTASDGTTYDNSASREFCVPGDTAACSPPVGHWRFDEGTGSGASSVKDYSGYEHHGTMDTSMTANDWVQGHYGKGLQFEDLTEYVTIGNYLDFGTGNFSISAWVKANQNRDSYRVVTMKKQSTGVAEGYVLGIGTSGTVNGRISDASVQVSSTSTTAVDDGRWHHIEYVVNKSSLAYIYVDGVLEDSDSVTSVGSTTNTLSLNFGCNSQNLALNNFIGVMDEIRIYDYARTPAQVAWDYNKGAPVSQWKFDECTGTGVNDSTGNSGAGTITIGGTGTQDSTGTCSSGDTGDAWYNGSTGKINSSLSLDGTDDYASFTNETNSTFDVNAITISMWIKPTNGLPYSDQCLLSTIIGSPLSGYQLCWSNSTNLYLYAGAIAARSTSATCPMDEWCHIVATYTESTTNGKIFVNGVDVTTESNSGTFTDNDQDLVIGARSDSLNYFFNGQIDEVKLFNYQITANQVRTLFNEGAAIKFGSD